MRNGPGAAESSFLSVIKAAGKGRRLAELSRAGWDENCPDETRGWSFCHADFPGITVWWTPGGPYDSPTAELAATKAADWRSLTTRYLIEANIEAGHGILCPRSTGGKCDCGAEVRQ